MASVRKVEDTKGRGRESAIFSRSAPDPRLLEKIYEVWTEGGDPIGPVSAEQIARGIRAGKVPSHASIKHHADVFWSDLLDAPDVVAALKYVSEEYAGPPPLVAQELTAPQYMVWTEGCESVGPVSADRIARGIRAGRVPSDARVRRVGELFSCDAIDEPGIIAALRQL